MGQRDGLGGLPIPLMVVYARGMDSTLFLLPALQKWQLDFWSLKILYLAAKSLQSCPTLCDPIDGSPPGFPVPGILQARTLEWVAISFSNA